MEQGEAIDSAESAHGLPPSAAATIVKAFWKEDAGAIVEERIAFAHLSRDTAAEACWRSLQPYL